MAEDGAAMIYFFVVPIWICCLIGGVVLLFFPKLRKAGVYAIFIPTSGLISSVAFSTGILIGVSKLGSKIGTEHLSPWYGIVFILAYFGAVAVGAIPGAVGAFIVIRKIYLGRKLNEIRNSTEPDKTIES